MARKSKTKDRTPKPRPGVVSSLEEEIRREIWPMERKVLFKPDRLRYVRKLIKPQGCVFCSAVKAGVSPESLLLYQDDLAIVVLNKYPYNNGHVLVLPRRHCGEFLQLTSEESVAINVCLKRSIEALAYVYGPEGFNVGLNLGGAAGAGIPEHLHYHLVPRWHGDTNFFPLIAETKVVIETVEASFAKLLPFFAPVPEKARKASRQGK
jgi:ATP adenylyltransferase